MLVLMRWPWNLWIVAAGYICLAWMVRKEYQMAKAARKEWE